MNNLRDIVRRHVEKETLRKFSEGKKEPTGPEEEKRLLEKLRAIGAIDSEVDNILGVFLNEIEKNSPRKKRRRWWNLAYAGLNVISATLVACSVKQDLWSVVGGLAFLSIIIHGIFMHFID